MTKKNRNFKERQATCSINLQQGTSHMQINLITYLFATLIEFISHNLPIFNITFLYAINVINVSHWKRRFLTAKPTKHIPFLSKTFERSNLFIGSLRQNRRAVLLLVSAYFHIT